MPSKAYPGAVRQVFVTNHPGDQLQASDFAIHSVPFGPVPAGHVVTRTICISLDPYLALNIGKAKAEGLPVPYAMRSRTVGEVVDPGNSDFSVGASVLGFGEWRNYDARPAKDLHKIDIETASPETHLGALGHSGFTAWLGLTIGEVKAGETVLISGAAGAVGCTAGQLAKRFGCHVVGIVGGPAKVNWVRDELGFDDCVDHAAPDFHVTLAKAVPQGVDLLFENVGSKTLDPALLHLKPRGRIALCGLMQHYQDTGPVCLINFRLILQKSIRIEPFSIYDHLDKSNQAQADLMKAVRSGGLVVEQTVTEGFENIPEAFIAMLFGKGRGKHVAKVG